MRYNIMIIKKVIEAFEHFKLFKFEKEDKVKLIEMYSTLLDIKNKYEDMM